MKRPPPRFGKSSRYPQKDPKKTGMIIAIGAFIMITGHFLYWEYIEDYFKDSPTQAITEQAQTETSKANFGESAALNEIYGQDQTDGLDIKTMQDAWRDWDKSLDKDAPKKIVIIIDDMGISRKLSYEALELPAPLTLAFLPYASGLKSITNDAKKNGHELMIHMPMEAMNPDLDLGAIALRDNMAEQDIEDNLDRAFKSFDGYVGINNHMGSRVTQNKEIMDIVMDNLKERDLLFVDSKTINSSVAADSASAHGLEYAVRDIFLDHEETDEFVANALSRVERVAQKNGYAIAIGHPKRVTIDGLKKWLPTLEKRGFEIVPISVVTHRDKSVTQTYNQ